MDNEDRARDIFISYSTDDGEIPNEVCEFLEENGYTCWIAPRNIRPGEDYAQEIMDGLNAAKMLVLISSENSHKSKYVLKEVGTAWGDGKPIISFNIDGDLPKDRMEYYLKTKQWLDASSGYEDSFDELLNEVVRLMPKGQEPPKPHEPPKPNQTHGPQRKPWYEEHKIPLIIVAVVVLAAVIAFVAFGGVNNSDNNNSSASGISIDYVGVDDDRNKGYGWKYSYFVFGSISPELKNSSKTVHMDFLDSSGKVILSNDTSVKDIDGNVLGLIYANNNNTSKVSLELRDSEGKVLSSAESSNIINQNF